MFMLGRLKQGRLEYHSSSNMLLYICSRACPLKDVLTIEKQSWIKKILRNWLKNGLKGGKVNFLTIFFLIASLIKYSITLQVNKLEIQTDGDG